MPSYRDSPTPTDRAKAIAFVVAVHVALGALMLSGKPTAPRRRGASPHHADRCGIAAPSAATAARRGARARQRKAPRARRPNLRRSSRRNRRFPRPTPVAAAPVAGTGAAASAGAAKAGTGPGAGGSGSGRGGGGSGGGIGSEARLISGGLVPRDYRHLRAFNAPSGRARLAIMVGTDGRVTSCRVNDSSGHPGLDSALCAILQPRMRWIPARDTGGTPISVRVFYIATWERF